MFIGPSQSRLRLNRYSWFNKKWKNSNCKNTDLNFYHFQITVPKLHFTQHFHNLLNLAESFLSKHVFEDVFWKVYCKLRYYYAETKKSIFPNSLFRKRLSSSLICDEIYTIVTWKSSVLTLALHTKFSTLFSWLHSYVLDFIDGDSYKIIKGTGSNVDMKNVQYICLNLKTNARDFTFSVPFLSWGLSTRKIEGMVKWITK